MTFKIDGTVGICFRTDSMGFFYS